MVDEGLRKGVQVCIPDLVNKYAGTELLEYAKCGQWQGKLCRVRMLMVSLSGPGLVVVTVCSYTCFDN